MIQLAKAGIIHAPCPVPTSTAASDRQWPRIHRHAARLQTLIRAVHRRHVTAGVPFPLFGCHLVLVRQSLICIFQRADFNSAIIVPLGIGRFAHLSKSRLPRPRDRRHRIFPLLPSTRVPHCSCALIDKNRKPGLSKSSICKTWVSVGPKPPSGINLGLTPRPDAPAHRSL